MWKLTRQTSQNSLIRQTLFCLLTLVFFTDNELFGTSTSVAGLERIIPTKYEKVKLKT